MSEQTTTPSVCFVTPEQNQIDREQMVAGLKLGQAVLEAAALRPNLTDEDRNKILHQAKKLAMPERFKDVSANDLKHIILTEYIEDASIEMITHAKERTTHFRIRRCDGDLVDTLIDHWKEKEIDAHLIAGNCDSTGHYVCQLKW